MKNLESENDSFLIPFMLTLIPILVQFLQYVPKMMAKESEFFSNWNRPTSNPARGSPPLSQSSPLPQNTAEFSSQAESTAKSPTSWSAGQKKEIVTMQRGPVDAVIETPDWLCRKKKSDEWVG